MPVYTLEQVQQHNSKGDLWMVLHNKVYDVSKFAEDHPGGEEAIYEESGHDATVTFEDIGHSDEAYDMLNDLYIGDLDTPSSDIPYKKNAEVPVPGEKTKGSALRIILPVLAVTGFLLYKFAYLPKKN
ncbi:cytochrome b5 [Backusella circina FSU 941]|nr:cytochrome b5 [Backusella circina FSU 941]